MGFFSEILSATVKTALIPVAVASDAVKLATGDHADTTENIIEDIGDDVQDAFDDLGDSDIW